MGRYAARTSVSMDRSQMEIQRILMRFGASQYVYGWDKDRRRALVGFTLDGKSVRISLPIPAPTDNSFARTPTGRKRSSTAIMEREWEQSVRQRWRALAAVIKAKLIAIEEGISTFEEEFLAHILLPNQRTVAEIVLPELDRAYKSGTAPEILLLPGGES